MTTDPIIDYHLTELERARHVASTHYAMPEFLDTDQAILDIGCGIGQTFVASEKIHGKLLVGLDVNLKCLDYGRSQFDYIEYVHGSAEHLPFRGQAFDLVIARVSLPYTDIYHSVSDAHRVLKPNGRVWLTLHPFSMTMKELIHAIAQFDVKEIVLRSYVLIHGVIFHLFGKQFSLFNKRYESFQTIGRMRRVMKYAGFQDVFVGMRDGRFMVTGRKVG